MKLSVIIPTYRPQNYLWECLSSLTGQTLDRHDFEVIIVLNGCNEPFHSQIHAYVKNHMEGVNVHVLQTDQGGVSNARNLGIAHATGDYLAFIDDDDIISKDYFLDLLSLTPASLVQANVLCFTDNVADTFTDYLGAVFKRNKGMRTNNLFRVRSILSSACCKLIRRDIIGQQTFLPDFRRSEDALFMFSISKNVQDIAFSNGDAVYYRRIRALSASQKAVGFDVTLREHIKVIKAYTAIYWSAPTRYNGWLYLSRVIAAIVQHIIRRK